MKVNFNNRRRVLIVITAIAIIITAIAVNAQPGTDADPFISLSYLNAATSLAPVSLEGGEELQISGGFGLVLLEGFTKIFPPDNGDSWIVDVTDGEIYVGNIDMSIGHMYVVVSENSDAVFTLQARQESVIGIPGGAGG